jgi:hypothetical protein
MANILRIVKALVLLAIAAFIVMVIVGVYTALDSATRPYALAPSISQTGTGDSGDLMRFGQANYLLSNQPWFLDNVKSWVFYSNDDTDDPDEYVVEDVKGYYLGKRQAIA